MSSPPAVVEINIADFNNPFIFKVYRAFVVNEKYIGLSSMTANLKFIVHLMLDFIE